MPCDSITTQSINLANAIKDLVRDAMTANHYNVVVEADTGLRARKGGVIVDWAKGKGLTVTASSPQRHIDTITQAYSARAITWAAQRAGWQVKQDATNTLTITKR